MHNPTPLSTYTQAYKIARIARKKEQGNINIYPFRFHTQRESKEPPPKKNKTKKTPGRPSMQTDRDNMRIAGRHPSPSSRKEKSKGQISSRRININTPVNSDRLKPNINPLS
jgi:hypothetical protein